MELSDVPLFRGLTADEAEAAVAALRMRRRAFAKGEILLEAGQRAPALGVALGGGATLLKHPASAADGLCRSIILDDVCLNAKGYERLTERMSQKHEQ